MKILKLIPSIFAGLLTVILIGLWCENQYLKSQLKTSRLLPIKEIQRQIGCTKIDGIWGSETDRLYKRAINNQYAEKYFTSRQYEKFFNERDKR